MKTIKLTNSDMEAIVDDDMYDTLKGYRWYLTSRGYVCRGEYLGNRRMMPITIHSHVLPQCPKGMVRDHISGNKLDNQRNNLRVVTVRQNVINCKAKKKFAAIHSSFKGVSWHKQGRKWMARIKSRRKNYYLGLFNDETEAAEAYNSAAILHFGDYARLNAVDKL